MVLVKGGNSMIKVEVIESFTLGAFDKLKNINRNGVEQKGKLFVKDTFECTKDMADYLLGKNALNRPFVKIIEVIPDKVEEKAEVKEIKKRTTKKRKSIAND